MAVGSGELILVCPCFPVRVIVKDEFEVLDRWALAARLNDHEGRKTGVIELEMIPPKMPSAYLVSTFRTFLLLTPFKGELSSTIYSIQVLASTRQA